MTAAAPARRTDPRSDPPAAVVSVATEHPAGARPATVVHLRGELDIFTAAPLLPMLLRLPVPPGGELVLDLTGVSFCDSAGINLFVRLDRRMRTGTALRLRGIGPGPARVLRLLGIPAALRCDFAAVPPRP